ncbi:MAG: amidohydrolase family protein [Caldilineaceae bacterium]
MSTTLLDHGDVVAYINGEHTVLRDAQVVYDGDRIVFVGRGYDGAVDQHVDARGKLVIPGLINHHMAFGIHMQMYRLDRARPNFFNSGLGFGVQSEKAYHGGGPRSEDWRASAAFAMTSALRSGTTTFLMVPNYGSHPYRGRVGTDQDLVDVTAASGLRAYLSLPHMSGIARGKEDGTLEWVRLDAAGWEGLEHAVDFARTHNGAADDRIRTFLFPYQADNCSVALLRATKDAARNLGCLLKIHTAQYYLDFIEMIRRTAKTPIQYLADADFLGPEVCVAHAIFTQRHPWLPYPKDDDTDTRLLVESGASVAHCPVVYARTGFVLHSLSHYVRAGIPVSLGTDTSPHDMFMEMRTAALLNKLTEADATAGTASEVFDAATIGGARALQRDDLGRLEAGAKADIVLVDVDRDHLAPVAAVDPIQALVYCARGKDVDTVIVDGVTRVRGGDVLGADFDTLFAEAKEFNRRLHNSVAGSVYKGQPITEYYGQSFPMWSETSRLP